MHPRWRMACRWLAAVPGGGEAARQHAFAAGYDGEPVGRAPSRRDDVPLLVRCGGDGEAGVGGAAVQTCTI